MPITTYNSILSPGVVVTGGNVNKSVLSPSVRVESGAEVSDSVLLQGVKIGRGAVVRHAILDKNVVVAEGVQVGVDQADDLRRGLRIEDGLTVVAKDQVIPAE
jgi:glucose-1-phosphate adenylyltransferase